jgi:hypothetical protein
MRSFNGEGYHHIAELQHVLNFFVHHEILYVYRAHLTHRYLNFQSVPASFQQPG